MTEKKDILVKNKKYELVPPDGGWGYMIWIAAIINLSSGMMFIGCFGMIFNEFLVQLNMGSTSVTLLAAFGCISLSTMGYLTGPLLKIMGLRKLALLGAFLFNLGAFLLVFANTKLELFIYQGFLQYGGIGILYNLSSTLINDYFLRKRFLSVSITQTVSAVASMMAPQFVKWSLEEFGYRGTLLLISAISLQSFVAVVIMQPVEWHMTRVEVAGDAEEGVTKHPRNIKKDHIKHYLYPAERVDVGDLIILRISEMKLLLVDEKTDNSKHITTPTITVTKIDSSFDDKVAVMSEIMDINRPGDGRKKVEFRKLFSDMWDVDVMKKSFRSNALIGPSASLAFESLFFLMLPQALYSTGWDKDEVAKALSLVAFGDLATRLSLTFFSKWFVKAGSQEIYVFGLTIAVASRLVMLWSENVTVILICITLMGIPHCTISVLPPLIIAESFTSAQFTSAIGIFMMMIGVLNLIIGPAIGAVRDMTDSYPTVFYIITSCFSVVLLMWTIELVYKKNKHRRKLQEIARKERALKKNKSKA